MLGLAAPSAPPPAINACDYCRRVLSVSLNGHDFTFPSPTLPFTFYNDSQLTVTEILPRSGPVAGGTTVTLRGSGLTPAGGDVTEAQCRFGNVTVRVLSALPDGTELVCAPTTTFSPDGGPTPWAVPVAVAPNGANFVHGRQPMQFHFYSEPVLAALLPGGGPTIGGTTVRVQIPGVEPGPHTDAALARCRYGRREPGAVVNVTAMDVGSVTCGPSPATLLYDIGVDKELQIALNGEQFTPASVGVRFRYYVQPRLSAVWPTGGAMSGGTAVTLHGIGFDRLVADDTSASGVPAPGGNGRPLCLFGGHCFDEHAVHRGLGCRLSPSVTATADLLAAPATLVSNNVLLCRSPAGPQSLTTRARASVRVALALNAQNFVHSRTPLYVFHSGVSVADVQPTSGPPLGGVEVRVDGANFGIFGDVHLARCRFSRWTPLLAAAAMGQGDMVAETVVVAAEHKTETGLVCRTPHRLAGTSEIEMSINGHDFHGGSPPLRHRYACEQLSGMFDCVTSHSCGFCKDELPPDGLDWTAWGITQTRLGCLECHADGCGAGPATGHCRRWTFETRMLMPSMGSEEALALRLANVTEPLERAARANGALLPNQMRYYRVRPERGGLRLHVNIKAIAGNLRLFARRDVAPGASGDEFDRISYDQYPRSSLSFTNADFPCMAPRTLSREEEILGVSPPAAGARCAEWVIGVLGNTFFPEVERTPRADLAHYQLSMRMEPDVPDFACSECGSDCELCGWSAGHSAQFLLDEDGTRVARLTNRSGQLGTLWLREPQPVRSGFFANFTFRISHKTLCTLPLEVLGANRTATVGAGRDFVPLQELRDAGQETTHYLTDHAALPFEPLRPPTGVPEDLADIIGVRTNPPALGGTFDPLPVTGMMAPFLPHLPAGPDFNSCPQNAEIGGEGFAFVLQWEGPDAAGCGGAGVGWADAPGCDAGLPSSVAVQFDTHQNLRIERVTGKNKARDRASRCAACMVCKGCTHHRVPDSAQVRSEDQIVYERQNALGVFTGGRNDVEAASQGILLLEQPGMVRFDDGEVHEVVLHYTAGQGQLDIYLDRSRERLSGQPTLTVHHSCQELAAQSWRPRAREPRLPCLTENGHCAQSLSVSNIVSRAGAA